MKCPPCNGTGRDHWIISNPCRLCNGVGQLPDTRLALPRCAFCNATGRDPWPFGHTLCRTCAGWGRAALSAFDWCTWLRRRGLELVKLALDAAYVVKQLAQLLGRWPK